MSPDLRHLLSQQITACFPGTKPVGIEPVGGGCINDCYRIETGAGSFFCKINSASTHPHLFQKEKAGLELIERQKAIKTPSVVACLEQSGQQILLLEWVEQGERTELFWKRFGEQLAAVHSVTSTDFGLEEDNYMGSVPQSNRRHGSWAAFFNTERLEPLVNRCYGKQLLSGTHLQQFERVAKKLESVFAEEPPSLLHGDLWSGNFLCNRNGYPVLIDPAAYYGHRSADLAMTTLFGGFRRAFYEAYHFHFPLPPNYQEQWELCNLYPLLIHLYLFGTAYLPQIERTLRSFS